MLPSAVVTEKNTNKNN